MRMVLTGMTVGKWRSRFRELGLVGLHDELRPGRPRSNEDDKVAEVIHCALQTKPTDGSTPWSARTLAAASGISKTTGHRWPQTFSVQPQRQNHVMLATDPLFVENVRDNVGLYWKPPDKAMVPCVDEMTQSQALERTPPLCPWAWVAWRGVTHADIRHDTTTLFAALDVVTGEVISPCKPRHRHQEFLGFLRLIEKSVPEGLEMHLIVANTCTPRLAMVLAWLAQRHRFHLHDTPTYASWLNQVERWFGILTQRAMRCGSFSSVKELIARIEQFVAACNKTKAPSNWTATTDSILAKLQRHGSQICGTAP